MLLRWIKRLWAPAAAVLAAIAFFFTRGSGRPSDEERRLDAALRAEKRRRMREQRDRDREDIERETQKRLDGLDDGGDDGFMDRAFDHDRANNDE